MATSDSYPLDFYKGFLALRTALEKAGTWELYHDSFVNWAIEGVSINLRVARSYEGYTTIACAMARGGFERLDILGFPREKADLPWCYDHVHALATQSFEESLFWQVRFLHDKQAQIENDASYTRLEIERLRGIIADRDDMIADRDSLIHDVMNSKSFKIGRCLSALPRKVRDLLRGVN
jgi:glycosyltransferase EpsH